MIPSESKRSIKSGAAQRFASALGEDLKFVEKITMNKTNSPRGADTSFNIRENNENTSITSISFNNQLTEVGAQLSIQVRTPLKDNDFFSRENEVPHHSLDSENNYNLSSAKKFRDSDRTQFESQDSSKLNLSTKRKMINESYGRVKNALQNSDQKRENRTSLSPYESNTSQNVESRLDTRLETRPESKYELRNDTKIEGRDHNVETMYRNQSNTILSRRVDDSSFRESPMKSYTEPELDPKYSQNMSEIKIFQSVTKESQIPSIPLREIFTGKNDEEKYRSYSTDKEEVAGFRSFDEPLHPNYSHNRAITAYDSYQSESIDEQTLSISPKLVKSSTLTKIAPNNANTSALAQKSVKQTLLSKPVSTKSYTPLRNSTSSLYQSKDYFDPIKRIVFDKHPPQARAASASRQRPNFNKTTLITQNNNSFSQSNSSVRKASTPTQKTIPKKTLNKPAVSIKNTPDKIMGLKYRSKSIENEITKRVTKESNESFNDKYSSNVSGKSYEKEKSLNISWGKQKETFGADSSIHFTSGSKNENLNFSLNGLHNTTNQEDEEHTFRGDAEQMKLSHQRELCDRLDSICRKVHIKTFLSLRNIIKPHLVVLLCSQALIKLFAGVDDSIPEAYSDSKSIDWSEIKILFNSPIKLINLIGFFKDLTKRGLISKRNVKAAQQSLEQIPPQINTIQHDAYYQIFEFVSTAIEFHKFYNSNQSIFNTSTQSGKKRPKDNRSNEASPNLDPFNSTYYENNSLEDSSKTPDRKNQMYKTEFSPSNNTSPLINYFQKNLNEVNDSLKKIGEKRRGLEEKVKSLTRLGISDSEERIGKDSSLENLNHSRNTPKKFNSNSSQKLNMSLNLSSISKPKNREKSIKHEYQEILSHEEEIQQNLKEAKEYKSRVGKMLVEHERYVKSLLAQKEQKKLETDREEEIKLRQNFENYVQQKKKEEEQDIRRLKNINAKDLKEKSRYDVLKEKERLKDDLSRSYNNHLVNFVTQQEKKITKKKEVIEKGQNIAMQRLLKKRQELEEKTKIMEEFADYKRKQMEWRKLTSTKDKIHWQKDYLVLSQILDRLKE